MDIKQNLCVLAVATLVVSSGVSAAHAGSRDTDRDGIPNRWERTHGMNPLRAADATRDFDRDRLTNLREYRLGSLIRDEDTDNDGHDDGDEVTDGLRGTDIGDRDSDDDGTLDGDEDSDRDGIDNEDEDDAREVCARDDDDRDHDSLTDEDENELGLRVASHDSDGDGVGDGDEDTDEDGEANEDGDDAVDDLCDGDRDGDGEADEDEGDLFGTIASYDVDSGTLVVTSTAGHTVTGIVTDDTEIELEEADGDHSEDVGHDADESDESDEAGDLDDDEGTTADLQPGVQVAELEFDDDSGTLDEVEIYRM